MPKIKLFGFTFLTLDGSTRIGSMMTHYFEEHGCSFKMSWSGWNHQKLRCYKTVGMYSAFITNHLPSFRVHKVESFFSSKLPPMHSWLDSRTLAIGWGNSVVVSMISVRKHVGVCFVLPYRISSPNPGIWSNAARSSIDGSSPISISPGSHIPSGIGTTCRIFGKRSLFSG